MSWKAFRFSRDVLVGKCWKLILRHFFIATWLIFLKPKWSSGSLVKILFVCWSIFHMEMNEVVGSFLMPTHFSELKMPENQFKIVNQIRILICFETHSSWIHYMIIILLNTRRCFQRIWTLFSAECYLDISYCEWNYQKSNFAIQIVCLPREYPDFVARIWFQEENNVGIL